jgi:hypothetical protein
MRMSPGASAPHLRTCVMLPGLRRRACWRNGSGGPADSLAEQDAGCRGQGDQRRHAPGGRLLEAAAAGRLRGYLLRGGHAVVPRTTGRIRRTSRRDEGLTGARLASHAAKAAIPGGSRSSSRTPAGRRPALLGDLDCALGRQRCRGRSVPRRRGRPCASPVPTFLAESCSRCPRARPPRSGRGCAARGWHEQRRADHADRATPDHPVRDDLGTDDVEPAACPPQARPGRQP